MSSQVFRAVLALTLLCASFVQTADAASLSLSRVRKEGVLIVKLRLSISPEEKAALEELFARFKIRVEKNLLHGKAFRIKTDYADFDKEILKQLNGVSAVEYAESDYMVSPTLVPQDSYYPNQWFHATIGSEKAWQYMSGDKDVKVVVCDSAFDIGHPDLAPNLLPGYNVVNNSSVIVSSNDHGTNTAGLIGAVGNNAAGVTGMNWQIGLIPVQISDRADGNAAYSDIAECIQYATDRGAKVVNISYGHLYESAIVRDAAKALRAKGGLVVVSAGNDATDISAVGGSPELLVVGATNINDQLATFSNFGTPVDLVAPGVDIVTTSPGAAYTTVNGTSFSAPITSGTAALIYALNPSFTPEQVEYFLLTTVDREGVLADKSHYGAGRLNAGAAVQAAYQNAAASTDKTPPTVTMIPPAAGEVSGTITINATAQDNVGVESVFFFIDGVRLGSAVAPYTMAFDTAAYPDGAHTLSAIARDMNGNFSAYNSVGIQIRNAPQQKQPEKQPSFGDFIDIFFKRRK